MWCARALSEGAVPRLLCPVHLPNDEIPMDPHEITRIYQLEETQPRDTWQFSIAAISVGETHTGGIPQED
jgi:hypothetical protein